MNTGTPIFKIDKKIALSGGVSFILTHINPFYAGIGFISV